MGFFANLKQLITTISATDIIDIAVISVMVYYLIVLVKETRAEQLIKGFVAILIFAQLSDWLNLHTVNWVLSNIMTAGFILVIVVFQPELRRVFESLGRSQGWLRNLVSNNAAENKQRAKIEEMVRACSSLARQKIGALIVLEGNTGLSDIIENGTRLDGLVSSELLINIFIPNTPLHDGAVVIRGDRILAASVFLPLTQNKSLEKDLGTRHRAAIGISERSDALVIVVSEETGHISICKNGVISRYIDEGTLRSLLKDFYEPDLTTPPLLAFLRNEDKDKKPEDRESYLEDWEDIEQNDAKGELESETKTFLTEDITPYHSKEGGSNENIEE